tara:strand:+ start:94 stop:351 length:258 start_codon:yes stop_codon:yes gene_type:complete
MNDNDTFSDKLMEITKLLQSSDELEKKLFGELFMIANKMAESGFTQDQLQTIVITAYQCYANPQLKQLFDILLGQIEIDPNEEFH